MSAVRRAFIMALFFLAAVGVRPQAASSESPHARSLTARETIAVAAFAGAYRNLVKPITIATNGVIPRDTCVSTGPPPYPGWGVGFNCYLPDAGATVTMRYNGMNKAAQGSGASRPEATCPDPTNWSWSGWSDPTVDPNIQVSFSPTTSSNGGSCTVNDPTVSVTLTRTAVFNTNYPYITGHVNGAYTFCLPPSEGGCAGPNSEGAINVALIEGNQSPFTFQPERPCGRCNGTTIGHPIDVATGELWNQKTDLQLSGPFGLSFTRFYGSQTAGTPELGDSNWLHNYSARLDVDSAVAGVVTYYDFQGMPYYFGGVATGMSSYDSNTGMTLALSADGTTYTLTSFAKERWTFNAKGEATSLSDRAGNTQTIARDTTSGHYDRITSVTDPLGRQLCFYYDITGRIKSVAAWMQTTACPSSAPATSVTTPVVTMVYDAGPNCSYGELCAVTEPDGNSWSYQYADTNKTTNLTKVLDPLGNPEEINTYSGLKAIHQETGLCSTSPCAETGGYINITYPSAGGNVVTVTDGLSRQSTITYDLNTLLLTRISGPLCACGGDQTRAYTYDAYGRLVTATDDAVDGSTKHTVTYNYNRDGGGQAYPGATSIVENVDTGGTTRTTTFAYYPVGDPRQDLPQTITEPSVDQPGLTNSTTDTYSTTGLLTQRAMTGYVNGTATTYTQGWTYDARGRVLTQTGPRTDVTQRTTYAYFADTDSDATRAGQLQSVTDALGHSVQFSGVAGSSGYTPFGNPQSTSDPNHVSTQYVYDARGRLLSRSLLPVGEGDQTLTTRMSYDAAGRRTQQTLPAGNATFYTYDTSDRVTQIKRADTSLAQHERLLVTYDAADATTAVAAQTCPTPAAVCASWATQLSSTYGYSSTTADLTQVTNADGTSKRVTYTGKGSLATFNDENHTSGGDVSFAYDVAGRRLSETHVLAGAPGGTVGTRYAYDLHDNLSGVTDPNGNVTSYHYDDFDRVVKETSPVTGVTTYAYDPDNNLIASTNANGTTSAFTYDALNRMLTETDTKGSATASEAWTYDDAGVGHFGIGRLATMTDPSGSTAFTYDRRGYLEVENHNVAGGAFTYGYGYDVNGNRSSMTYPDGTIVSYTFDFADRPYSATQTLPGGGGTLSVGRRAKTLARLRALGLPAPHHLAKSELAPGASRGVPVTANPSQTRSATTPGRAQAPAAPSTPSATVTSRTLPGMAGAGRALRSGRPDSTLVASATYAAFGPMTSMAFGNGTTQTMTYNQRYLPVENKLVANGTTIADHVYSENAVGNVTAVSDALDAGYARSFGYDDLNRLTTANSGSKLWGTANGNGYTYDAMGNIQTLQTGRTATFSYRAGASGSTGLPMLTSVNQNGTVRTVNYDAAGSELTDGVNTFAYGARELLGSALPTISAYAFDGFRRRVATTLASGSAQRASFYDTTDHLLAESETSAAPAAIAYEFMWFGDRPVAQLDPNGTHWTFADHLGLPLLQTDGSGAVSWQAEHEPYGRVYSLRGGDVHQPLRFPGQESQQFDNGPNGAVPFSYNGTRWYSPTWARYTTSDTIGLDGGDNLYRYAADRPLMLTDFHGTAPWAPPLPKIRCPKWGLDRVKANVLEAQRPGHALNPFWFRGMVATGKSWDFKNDKSLKSQVPFDDLDFTGNFNYGATGNAAGFSLSLLLAEGASGASEKNPQGNPGVGKTGLGGSWPYGETPSDANIEHDGYIWAEYWLNMHIDLCRKKQQRRC